MNTLKKTTLIIDKIDVNQGVWKVRKSGRKKSQESRAKTERNCISETKPAIIGANLKNANILCGDSVLSVKMPIFG